MRRCCMCKIEKPETEFAFRSLATGKRQDHCRQCHAAYRRQHYLDNRAIYIAREVARIKGYRETNRVLILAYLRTHPCVDCGESDPVLLEFDHRDRLSKRGAVTWVAVRKPWKVVRAEIEKCDVRCIACHRRRTATQFNWRKVRSPSLTAGPELSNAPAIEPVDVQLRTCTECHVMQPITAFVIKDGRTGRRGTRCRPCVAAASREHYRNNRDAYLRRPRTSATRRREPERDLVLAYLNDHPCVDCGESDPLLLEFDHRDRATKVGAVSHLLWQRRWSEAAAEIAKCDVRCVRCHRRKTANDFGWKRLGEDPTMYVYAGVL